MTQLNEQTATLHAYFGYRDAPAALRWLEKAFGFVTTLEFPDDNGGVMHAELRRGDAAIMVFSDDEGYERAPRKGPTCGQGTYLVLASPAEVDEVFAAAVAAGAEVIWEPADTEWGNYRCRVADIEGYEWTFGVHRPGEPVSGEWDQD
ncbi:VOC family protein [Marinactinospora endophytica]